MDCLRLAARLVRVRVRVRYKYIGPWISAGNGISFHLRVITAPGIQVAKLKVFKIGKKN